MKAIKLAVTLALVLAGCGGSGGSDVVKETPTQVPAAVVAVTFDHHSSTATTAFPVMRARGLVGTFFNEPAHIDNGAATTAQLNEMRAAGWSIQAYSGRNMSDLLAADGETAARAHLMAIRRDMAALVFPVTALAPAQRAWSARLAELAAEAGYVHVRAVGTFSPEPYPFATPLFIAGGGTASLSSADTAASLEAQLSALKAGEAWIIVIHKVGDDADPRYSVSLEAFEALCNALARERQAGRLQVITF